MIGPLRSIFWISGDDELVRMVDDPAYVLEDELVTVPFGTSPARFLVDMYYDQGKIPRHIVQRYTGYKFDLNALVPDWVVPVISIQVTGDVRSHALSSLYPASRPQCFRAAVKCIRVKDMKSTEQFFNKLRNEFNGGLILDSPNILYRGLFLFALEKSLAWFVPGIHNRQLLPNQKLCREYRSHHDFQGS